MSDPMAHESSISLFAIWSSTMTMIKNNNQAPSRRQQRSESFSSLLLLFLLLSLVAIINTLVVSIHVATPDPRPSSFHDDARRSAEGAAADEVHLPRSNDKMYHLPKAHAAGVRNTKRDGKSPRKEATGAVDDNAITVPETGSFANCTTHSRGSQPQPLNDDSSHPDQTSITVSCHTFRYRMPPIRRPWNGKNNDTKLQIVIGVLSGSNAEGPSRRQAIRDTWASRTSNHNLRDLMHETGIDTNHEKSSSAAAAESSTAVFFLVAGLWQSIQEEYERFRDLIWFDQTEVYDGETSVLTFKTLGFLKIVHDAMEKSRGGEDNNYGDADDSWKDVEYVFKTDDDCFVNIDLLKVHLLGDTTTNDDREHTLDDSGQRRNNAHLENENTIHYWGNCKTDEKISPLRGTRYKWGISENTYPERYYPPYCQGVGFAVSRTFLSCAASDHNHHYQHQFDNVHYLDENHNGENHISKMRFMPFEDVAVGILAERCGVKPTSVDDPRLIKQYRTNLREERFKIKNGMKKIGKGKLPMPDMEGRIVVSKVYWIFAVWVYLVLPMILFNGNRKRP